MRLAAAFAISAALLGPATAAETAPLLIFSSDKVPAVDALSSSIRINDHASALAHVLEDEQMCEFDVVIVASAPDFHISQLRSSSSSTHTLLRRYRSAASSCHLPYLSFSPPSPETAAQTPPCAAAKQLAQKCNANYMQMQVDDSASFAWDGKAKYVLCLEAEAAPHAEAETSANSRALDTLAAHLTALTARSASHLVALSGVPMPIKLRTRAPNSPHVRAAAASVPAASYRLLTPPLILSLGIVFGLVVPFLLVVISALAGIRSPVRENASGKSRVVGMEKKNQ